MNILVLVGIIVIAIILVITAFVVIAKKPKKTISHKKVIQTEDKLDFEDLMAIVKNPNSTTDKLLFALEEFNKNFVIDEKNKQKYLIFLSRALTHKNVNRDIFQYFHKEIKSKNVRFKKELDLIERKALG